MKNRLKILKRLKDNFFVFFLCGCLLAGVILSASATEDTEETAEDTVQVTESAKSASADDAEEDEEEDAAEEETESKAEEESENTADAAAEEEAKEETDSAAAEETEEDTDSAAAEETEEDTDSAAEETEEDTDSAAAEDTEKNTSASNEGDDSSSASSTASEGEDTDSSSDDGADSSADTASSSSDSEAADSMNDSGNTDDSNEESEEDTDSAEAEETEENTGSADANGSGDSDDADAEASSASTTQDEEILGESTIEDAGTVSEEASASTQSTWIDLYYINEDGTWEYVVSERIYVGDTFTFPEVNSGCYGWFYYADYTYFTPGWTYNVSEIYELDSSNPEFYCFDVLPVEYYYSISYEANKPSGASGSASSFSYWYYLTYEDKSIVVTWPTISLNGWTFTGWNTESDGSGTSYSAGDTLTYDKSYLGKSLTLYAQWTANTYTVKYDSNKPSGASGTVSGSMSSQSMTYDTSSMLNTNEYSLTGWTFQGWSTSSSATTATYTDEATVENLTSTSGGTVTLYAVWTANTYTVTFSTNVEEGKDNVSGTMTNMSMTYDVAGSLGTNVFSRDGYQFVSWNTKSDGSGTSYGDGAEVVNLTSEDNATVTLYAQWRLSSVTVSVTKQISADDVVWEQGNPTFIILLTGTETTTGLTRYMYKTVTFTESEASSGGTLSKTVTFDDIPCGTYTVSEQSVSRWDTSRPSVAEFSGGSIEISSDKVEFTLSEDEGVAAFEMTGTHTSYTGLSDNDLVQ